MHRYSLPRAEALQRLQRQAAADGRPLAMQAQRVVEAVETLARGAGD
jgi:two-component system, response regulator PdtaR